jgi:DNA-binding CsgD family transcriptional regulator
MAATSLDVRRLLATECICLAVVDARACWRSDSTLGDRQVTSWHRPRIVLVTREFSSGNVLRLAEYCDLVLPSPLESGTLLRALEMLGEWRDSVEKFALQYKLSPRETALLRCALACMNNDEAAAALSCSRNTVSTFWNRIFRKTGVSGQRDVIVLLLQWANENAGSGTFAAEPGTTERQLSPEQRCRDSR